MVNKVCDWRVLRVLTGQCEAGLSGSGTVVPSQSGLILPDLQSQSNWVTPEESDTVGGECPGLLGSPCAQHTHTLTH